MHFKSRLQSVSVVQVAKSGTSDRNRLLATYGFPDEYKDLLDDFIINRYKDVYPRGQGLHNASRFLYCSSPFISSFHPFTPLSSFALPSDSLLPWSMAYPNWIFSVFSFIGFLLCAIPLYWHLEGSLVDAFLSAFIRSIH